MANCSEGETGGGEVNPSVFTLGHKSRDPVDSIMSGTKRSQAEGVMHGRISHPANIPMYSLYSASTRRCLFAPSAKDLTAAALSCKATTTNNTSVIKIGSPDSNSGPLNHCGDCTGERVISLPCLIRALVDPWVICPPPKRATSIDSR